ncbi:malate synthase A [Saprolegnia parasitica CBS 223.65]|uniref:Malate synthase n=1 Tax=Saprolegnia parasitica (strain CBS 223.65) TaxID=695850 RepID=A0A067D0T4_SAPPC|nr:malate synthase A [Saprolegnia parasitica CBS 223.65]KDO32637.1 malate synthase A [Saprolegnia parasitica CBS 223.65]|eukprot:XP_012196304.1 malate synthase A [Saprolegnia parasitica CBS 223.65]
MTQAHIRILGAQPAEYAEILSPDAMRFVAYLHEAFEGRRQALLQARVQRQKELDAGRFPTFLPETKYIRESEWKVASIPKDLEDRRVEITGPVDRKMVINGLNSGAKCYMADLEDSSSPTWATIVSGQINLRDAVRRTISYDHPATGKKYVLNATTATLLVRPRGWHLDEAHVTINNQVVSGSLFDFALYFFHNVHELRLRGSAPYFYLPKLESHLEARLWNDVFVAAQKYLAVPVGTIRATVLIETLLAGYEMDEILFELKEHSSGLNCGRWDYIFSFIKKLRNHKAFVLPDRAAVGMTTPFMASYVKLLIHTCHRRGAHAMGGMAAQIPVKNDPALNDKFMAAVRDDKLREAKAGHDGTWVAHPGLVQIAMDVFNEVMPTPHQIAKVPAPSSPVNAADLIAVPTGPITAAGLEENVDVALVYTEAWLRGNGCIPLHNKMEDAATAEISRAQVWQWLRHEMATEDKAPITKARVLAILAKCTAARGASAPAGHKYQLAHDVLLTALAGDEFDEFLTLPCYPHVVSLA